MGFDVTNASIYHARAKGRFSCWENRRKCHGAPSRSKQLRC